MKHDTASPVSWIEIDLQQFRDNIQTVRAFCQTGTKLCLPVKANAYGHGLIEMAKASVDLVDYFAVAHVQEGVQLRNAGISKPILVFGGIDAQQMDTAIHCNLQLTVASPLKAKLIHDAARKLRKRCSVHIKVDTGMLRVGVRPESLTELYRLLAELPLLQVEGLYSHLATADGPENAFAKIQLQVFTKLVTDFKQRYPDAIAHIAHSAGLCYYANSQFDMIRSGLLCFGHAPNPQVALPTALKKIKPFYSLKARVSYYKVVAAGRGISYDHTYVTRRESRVATIPIGYGDGLPRCLSNKGHVLIRGRKYPIAGLICMDSFMVDLGTEGSAYVGDEVVLIGCQGNEAISLQSVAEQSDTIINEILCGFNNRVPRVYSSYPMPVAVTESLCNIPAEAVPQSQ